MTNAIIQDIAMGNGVCVVDPHGELIDDVLEYIPPHRQDDVIVFSPAITDRPLGLNMLEYDPLKPTQKTLITDTLFAIWDKLYNLKATGGPMFEMYMKNSMRLVMAHPESGSTLMEIPKVLTDEDFRSFKLAMCDEPEVVAFWEKEATKAGGEAALENMVPYITSKLAPFVTNDFIRPMIGQQKSSINFREAMDNKKIILVKLEKGLIGETSAYLVGMIMVGSLLMAGMGRNDGLKYNLDGTTSEINKGDRSPFYVYIDEMQNFLFDAIPKALEEVRKYKVGFYLAHQFVKQVIAQGDERIKDSIMANCATKMIFRAGADDAQYLEKEFGPTLSAQDLMNPESFTCNAILLANGQKTTPFNFLPAPWPGKADPALRKRLIEQTKMRYGKDKAEVEKDIRNRAKLLF
jgi:flagellar basal body-associated protein FliL